MNRIVPFLWFDTQAEEAVNFYVSVFKNSRVVSMSRCGDAGPGPKGSVLTVSFQLEGQDFMALNGGPQYQFNPAVSFYVNCETQAEVDELWAKLTADDGAEVACGWVRDRYGVSWQIIPTVLIRHLEDRDPVKAGRVMQAMMKMVKIDIKAIEDAYAGR